jgi:hypothetical protein
MLQMRGNQVMGLGHTGVSREGKTGSAWRSATDVILGVSGTVSAAECAEQA